VTGAAERHSPATWRAVLRHHAERVWREGLDGQRPDKAALDLLGQALGPLAEDALRIVEAYARGVRPTSGGTVPPAEFGSRLVIILNGVEAALGDRAAGDAPAAPAPHVIQSELWQILHKVRESAELSYSREQDLIELDRRILCLPQSA